MSAADTERREAEEEPSDEVQQGIAAQSSETEVEADAEPVSSDTNDRSSNSLDRRGDPESQEPSDGPNDLERRERSEETGEILDPDGPHGKHAKVMHIREEYSGALPHPRHIEHYGQIYPDAPRIIFTSFEEQGKHRRAMESKLLSGSERRATIGQVLGTILVGSVIVLGFVCVLVGQAVAGTTMVGLALTGGVLTYVFGDFPGKKK